MSCVASLMWHIFVSWVRWKLVQKLCLSIYQSKKNKDTPPIPEEGDHPLSMFEDTYVGCDVGRFVAFAVWLKQRPKAFYWYQDIEKQFPDQVPSILRVVSERLR